MSGQLEGGSVGKTGAEFLKIEVGGRAAAMAGAYTATRGDAFSLHYNPSQLGLLDRYEFAFQYQNYLLDINQHYLAGVIPMKDWGTFGVTLNLIDLGDFERTTLTSGQNGQVLGTFDGSDFAFTVGWGRLFGEKLSLGTSLKWIRSELESEKANAVALDLGLHYPLFSFWDIGLSLQNIGTELKFMSEGDPLPFSARLGNAFSFFNRHLTLSLDFIKYRFEDPEILFGAEWDIYHLVALRLGYNSQQSDLDEGLTAGLGVHFQGFSLDYAYVPFGELGNTHRVSLGYRFPPKLSDRRTPPHSRTTLQKPSKNLDHPIEPSPPVVNVPPFGVPSDQPELQWLAEALPNLLKVRLLSHNIKNSSLAYQYTLRGSLTTESDDFKLQIELEDKRGVLIDSFSLTTPRTELLTAIDTISQKIAHILNR